MFDLRSLGRSTIPLFAWIRGLNVRFTITVQVNFTDDYQEQGAVCQVLDKWLSSCLPGLGDCMSVFESMFTRIRGLNVRFTITVQVNFTHDYQEQGAVCQVLDEWLSSCLPGLGVGMSVFGSMFTRNRGLIVRFWINSYVNYSAVYLYQGTLCQVLDQWVGQLYSSLPVLRGYTSG